TRRARPAGRDRWSRLSKASGTNGRPLVFFISGAVQGLGQNARRGGLPHAARAREDVAVRHAVVENGVLQGLGGQPLADHFLEALRPILAGNDLVRHEIFDFGFSILDSNPGVAIQNPKSKIQNEMGQTSGWSAAHGEARYRCFLPDLAGFTSIRRTEPEV